MMVFKIKCFKGYFLAIFGTLIAFQSIAELYIGKIDKYPIVLEILQLNESDEYVGNYFYDKYKYDIELRGKRVNSSIVLEEQGTPEQKQLILNLDSGKGIWINHDTGKSFNIKTSKIESLPAPTNVSEVMKEKFETNLYEYLRQENLSFKATQQTHFMGFTLQWWAEPLSSMSYFTIEDKSGLANFDKVNSELERTFRGLISTYFSEGYKYTNQPIQPSYISNQQVSYYVIGSKYDSGIAFITNIKNPYNLDVKTGKELLLSDFLDYDKDYVSLLVRNKLLEYYPNEMENTDCNFTEVYAWDHVNQNGWLLDQNGILLMPDQINSEQSESCININWPILTVKQLMSE